MLPNDRAQPAAPDKPSWGARMLRLPAGPALAQGPRGRRRRSSWSPGRHPVRRPGLRRSSRWPRGGAPSVASSSSRCWGLRSSSSSLPAHRPGVLVADRCCPSRRRAGRPRQAAGPLVRAVPHGRVGAGSGRCRPASSPLKQATGQPLIGVIAAWLLAAAVARLADGQGHRRTPACTARTARPGPASGQDRCGPGPPRTRAPARAGGPAPTPVPRVRRPGPGRRAALRRSRRPRPSARSRPGRGRRSRSRTPWPNSTR